MTGDQSRTLLIALAVVVSWVAVGAFLTWPVGLWLIVIGRNMRHRRGLGDGRTISLDHVLLTAGRYRLTGRPDRLVKANGIAIPEEWKSARVLRPWHRAQMGVYFLLVEEYYEVKPPHGFLVCGDGMGHRIDNTDELRAWVLNMAGRIRAARAVVHQPIAVTPVPGQCRPCVQRGHCGQARI